MEVRLNRIAWSRVLLAITSEEGEELRSSSAVDVWVKGEGRRAEPITSHGPGSAPSLLTVPAGDGRVIRVVVSCPGYFTSSWSRLMAPNEDVTAKVVLRPSEPIRGRTLDRDTMEPIPGATVSTGQIIDFKVETDELGRLSAPRTSFDDARNKTHLLFEHPDYEPLNVFVRPDGAVPVTALLSRAQIVRLQAVDADSGSAIESVRIRYGVAAGKRTGRLSEVAAVDGEELTLRRLSRSQVYRGVVSCPGYADSYVGFRVGSAKGPFGYTVRMSRPITVGIRLVNAESAAQPGRVLSIELVKSRVQLLGPSDHKTQMGIYPALLNWTGQVRATTDLDGIARLRLPTGSNEISLLPTPLARGGRLWLGITRAMMRRDFITLELDSFEEK